MIILKKILNLFVDPVFEKIDENGQKMGERQLNYQRKQLVGRTIVAEYFTKRKDGATFYNITRVISIR